jgi:oligopeptide transport system permease protein
LTSPGRGSSWAAIKWFQTQAQARLMFRFILARLVQFPLILAVIYLLTFMFSWVVPGSPFERDDRQVSEQVMAELQMRFHAQSWQTFLAYYPWRTITQADFGPSMAHEGWSVNDILRSALPVSITLGVFALTIAVLGGVAIGALAAAHRGGAFDWLSLTVAMVGISVPSFVVASLLLLVFTAWLGWFPVGEWGSFRDLILPGLALSLLPMAYIARLTRVAMIDVQSSDFVRTARAKGVSRNMVIWKHCLKNAVLPVVSYLGPAAAATLTGSFVVEKVFNIPGLGQHFVNSVLNNDQTLILGIVMVYSFFVLLFNLLVDVSYALIDPRIEVGARV